VVVFGFAMAKMIRAIIRMGKMTTNVVMQPVMPAQPDRQPPPLLRLLLPKPKLLP
jgi:hypothetical protein